MDPTQTVAPQPAPVAAPAPAPAPVPAPVAAPAPVEAPAPAFLPAPLPGQPVGPDPATAAMAHAPQVGQEFKPTLSAMDALGLTESPSASIETMRQENIPKHGLEGVHMEATPLPPAQPRDASPASVQQQLPPLQPAPVAAPVPQPVVAPVAAPVPGQPVPQPVPGQPVAAPVPQPVAAPAPQPVVAPIPGQPAPQPAPTQAPHTQTYEIEGRHYTAEELGRIHKKNEQLEAIVSQQLSQQPQQPQVPQQPQQPQTPQQPQYTPEQIAHQAAELKTQEDQWVGENSKHIAVEVLDEGQLEKLLDGGPEAVQMFQDIRAHDAARTAYTIKASMYRELGPIFQKFEESMQPMQQYQRVQQEQAAETLLTQRHPEIAQHHIITARQIADRLVQQYPDETNAMPIETFIDEVAIQTERHADSQAQAYGFNSWRESPTYASPSQVPPAPQSVYQPQPAPQPPPAPMPAQPVNPAAAQAVIPQPYVPAQVPQPGPVVPAHMQPAQRQATVAPAIPSDPRYAQQPQPQPMYQQPQPQPMYQQPQPVYQPQPTAATHQPPPQPYVPAVSPASPAIAARPLPPSTPVGMQASVSTGQSWQKGVAASLI